MYFLGLLAGGQKVDATHGEVNLSEAAEQKVVHRVVQNLLLETKRRAIVLTRNTRN